MKRKFRRLAAPGVLLAALCLAGEASAQKSGGVLKISFFDNPGSACPPMQNPAGTFRVAPPHTGHPGATVSVMAARCSKCTPHSQR